MRFFIYKILLFSALVFAFLVLFEFLVRKIPNDYKYKNNVLTNDMIEFSIIILGHSQARDGLNPDLFDSTAFNFSNSAQSLNYDLQILKKAISLKSDIKTIVIPISYFTMYYTIEYGISSYLTKNYYLYMDLKVPSFKYRFELTSGLNLKQQFFRTLKFYVFRESPYISTNGYYADASKVSILEAKSDAKKTYLRQKEYIISGIDRFKSNELIILEIIEIAKNSDLKIIFFTPPLTNELIEVIPENLLKETSKYFSSIEENYSHVQYLNFLHSNNFELCDFKDSSHLNANGAKKLTKLINNYISN